MLTFIHVSMPNKIPEISPKFIDGKRMYETPDGNFPSITTVLGKLPRFNFGIKNWIEKVGEDFAKFESKRCLERGSQFHKITQSYLENKLDTNGFGLLAKSLFENIFNNEEMIDGLTKTRDALLPKLMSGEIRV